MMDIRVSQFGADVIETHISLVPDATGSLEDQIDTSKIAYLAKLKSLNTSTDTLVFIKVLCSDIQAQSKIMTSCDWLNSTLKSNCYLVSIIEQPPLNGAKVAFWMYHMSVAIDQKSKTNDQLLIYHNGYRHLWTYNHTGPSHTTIIDQTTQLFSEYAKLLHQNKMELSKNSMRTWIYVDQIDDNYQDMVKARGLFFDDHGLTKESHYIASTGIAGKSQMMGCDIKMDTYALCGHEPQQIQHLKGESHLSPTHLYQVTFERGTSIEYGDRKHIYISGTASIDPAGNILFPGDVLKQYHRTIENIEVLAKEANANLSNIVQMLVYLRNPEDYALIKHEIETHFPYTPCLLVHAPVCRPGWLIEIEGIFLVKHKSMFRTL